MADKQQEQRKQDEKLDPADKPVEQAKAKQHAEPRRDATEEEKEKDLELAREREESKQDFKVVQNKEGKFFVEGSDAHKASKKAKKAAPQVEGDEDESVVFEGRAENEEQAIAMANGTYKNPAEGAQRGSQTP